MIDTGHGSPIVLIPGIPGRWEWLILTLRSLAARHRVLSFSLHERVDERAAPDESFDAWIRMIDAMLDRAGEPRATLVGVSFGGLIAARYAAHRPDRTTGLVLVSAPSPTWKPDARTAGYLRYPRLAMSALVVRSCLRVSAEIVTAKPTWRSRIRFGLHYAGRAIFTPPSPTRMAQWVGRWMATDIAADCRRITCPTLLITGESHLDRAVPVAGSREYLTLIPGARQVVLERTGHVGVVTKPQEFARIVSDFIEASASSRDRKAAHAS